MNALSEHDWQPDPQLLAAYFDDAIPDADLRARVEAWLGSQSDAGDEAADLQKLMHDTAPVEPGEGVWQATIEQIARQSRRPATASRQPWCAALIAAASVVLFLGILFAGWRSYLASQNESNGIVRLPERNAPVDEFEVLTVATAAEVTILRIDGADVDAVLVGTMPVSGALDLADSGEVCISCKCPRIRFCQDPPRRPMVWAVASAD